jgi:hypothetical protein
LRSPPGWREKRHGWTDKKGEDKNLSRRRNCPFSRASGYASTAEVLKKNLREMEQVKTKK